VVTVRRRSRWIGAPLIAGIASTFVLLLALGGCASSGSSLAQGEQYYVSLGDSYATGFQQTGPTTTGNTRNGFPYQLPHMATAKGYHLNLVNFACAGASTTSMLSLPGCPADRRGPGEASYGKQTQIAAALAFIRAHRGRIGLVTMSVGANDLGFQAAINQPGDFLPCLGTAEPIPCLGSSTQHLQANVERIVAEIRGAAGPDVPIVGTNYPNIVLGYYVSHDATRDLVDPSLMALRTLINPALQAGYSSAGGTLVDVTEASGAYIPFSETTTLHPYGTIPVAVARVCQLTFMCEYSNIHATTAGYRLIADLVVGALPRR
jgi:lysophospholipase L1-like esterase